MSNKTGKTSKQEEEEMIETSGTLTPEGLSEDGSDEEHSPVQEMNIVKLEGEVSKLPLVLKQEPSKQEPLQEGEL